MSMKCSWPMMRLSMRPRVRRPNPASGRSSIQRIRDTGPIRGPAAGSAPPWLGYRGDGPSGLPVVAKAGHGHGVHDRIGTLSCRAGIAHPGRRSPHGWRAGNDHEIGSRKGAWLIAYCSTVRGIRFPGPIREEPCGRDGQITRQVSGLRSPGSCRSFSRHTALHPLS